MRAPSLGCLAMLSAHEFLAYLVVLVPAMAALAGGIVYWRRRGCRPDRRAPARARADAPRRAGLRSACSYSRTITARPTSSITSYGSLSLARHPRALMYAPAEGRKRLLWFAGTSFLAAALAVREFMTGS